MKENFTRPQLLLYAYNETDLLQSDATQRLIDGDPLIADEYKEITDDISSLDTFVSNPSEQTIANILAKAGD